MAEGDRDDHHPSPAELDRFLLGELSPRQAAPLLAHLIRGCAQCRQKMEPMASVMLETRQNIPEPSLDAGTEYDFSLFRAFAAARRYADTRMPGIAGLQACRCCKKPLSRKPPASQRRLGTGPGAKCSSIAAAPCATAIPRP